jgi:hypothetical protein
VPTAKQIAVRLGKSWTALVVAVAEAKQVERLWEPSRANYENHGQQFSVRHAYFAVRVAVTQLGHVPRDESELQLALSRAANDDLLRTRYGGFLHELLPSVNQLLQMGGGFAALLGSAGLERPPEERGRRGVALVDAADALFERLGRYPNHQEVIEFARSEGFALSKQRRGTSWEDHLVELRARHARAADEAASSGRGVEQSGLEDALPFRPRDRWPHKLVIEALAEYIDDLASSGGGVGPTQRDYRARRRALPDRERWPSVTTVGRRGRFHELIAEARTLHARTTGSSR